MNNYIALISPLVIFLSCRLFLFLLRCTSETATTQKIIRLGIVMSFIYLFLIFPIYGLLFDFYLFPIVSIVIIWVYFIFMSLLYDNYFERMINEDSLF